MSMSEPTAQYLKVFDPKERLGSLVNFGNSSQDSLSVENAFLLLMADGGGRIIPIAESFTSLVVLCWRQEIVIHLPGPAS